MGEAGAAGAILSTFGWIILATIINIIALIYLAATQHTAEYIAKTIGRNFLIGICLDVYGCASDLYTDSLYKEMNEKRAELSGKTKSIDETITHYVEVQSIVLELDKRENVSVDHRRFPEILISVNVNKPGNYSINGIAKELHYGHNQIHHIVQHNEIDKYKLSEKSKSAHLKIEYISTFSKVYGKDYPGLTGKAKEKYAFYRYLNNEVDINAQHGFYVLEGDFPVSAINYYGINSENAPR